MDTTQIILPILTLAIGVAVGLVLAKRSVKELRPTRDEIGGLEQAVPVSKRHETSIATPAEYERQFPLNSAEYLAKVGRQGRETLQSKRSEILRLLESSSEEANYQKEIVIHIPTGDYEIDDDGGKAFGRLRQRHPEGEIYKQRMMPVLSGWRSNGVESSGRSR